MRPSEFGEEMCTRYLEIWKEELGGANIYGYLRAPALLSVQVQDPARWIQRIFYERIGSRFSEDTKAGFEVSVAGDLEFSLYMHPEGGNNTPEEQEVEDRFLNRVRQL